MGLHDSLIQKMAEAAIIPVFSHNDVEVCKHVMEAAYKGGIKVFEFTNRQENAQEVFAALIDHAKNFEGMALGIGTIWDGAQAEAFIKLGADFVVSPILDKSTAEMCAKHGVAWMPGCGTLTEVISAHRLGAAVVKAFPGEVLGPRFVASALSVAPHLKVMPTGGVAPTQESLKSWFDAGVVCVGMGSKLFSKTLIAEGNWQALEENIKSARAIVDEVR